MPNETDPLRLDLLARLLLGAIGEVLFDRRAFTGSESEPDDLGLYAVLGKHTGESDCRVALRDALAKFLRAGRMPNRVDVLGDPELQYDPETRYEFRLTLNGFRVYVKTVLNIDDPDDPVLKVKCVKRQNKPKPD